MKKMKVLIKDYEISKDKKLITLLLKDLEDDSKDNFGIALLNEELGPMFGIGVIEEERLVKKMLDGITGKKVNLEMHATIKEVDVSKWKDGGLKEDSVHQKHSELDYYPYHELLTEMQAENEN